MTLRGLVAPFLRVVNFAAIVLWAIIPPLILLSFYVPLVSRLIGSLRVVSSLSIVWAISFFLVFLFLMLSNTITSTQNHGLQGLLCTLTLGLPSIALAAFPLVGPPAYLDRPVLDFKGIYTCKRNTCSLLVAIDVSHSFFNSRPEDRVKLISDAITQIFSEDGFGHSMRASDNIEVWIFAGNSDMWRTNELGGKGQIHIRKEIINSISQGSLRNLPEGSYCRDATDILTPLSSIVSKLEDSASPYSFARVIIFSDLVQSTNTSSEPNCNVADQAKDKDAVRKKVQGLVSRIKRLPQVSFVAFSAPAQTGSSPSEGSRLNVSLQKDLEQLGDQWQEINLITDWQSANITTRMLLPTNLYADIRSLNTPLQIRYIDSPSPLPRLCQLDLPDGNDSTNLIFGLRALTPGKTPLRLNLRAEGIAESRVLSLATGERYLPSLAT